MQPFAFPERAVFDSIVAKDKVYKQARASTAIKRLFQDQVGQIRCSYELTDDRLNLKSSVNVPKILIIQLEQKNASLNEKILETIDKAFGVPLLFELNYQSQIAYAACFRRRSEVDSSKWVFSGYFQSPWVDKNSEPKSIPLVLSMDALYESLIRLILPISSAEPLTQLIERITEIRKKENERDKLSSQINKTKQFNKKVELNRQRNTVIQQLMQLTTADTTRNTNG